MCARVSVCACLAAFSPPHPTPLPFYWLMLLHCPRLSSKSPFFFMFAPNPPHKNQNLDIHPTHTHPPTRNTTNDNSSISNIEYEFSQSGDRCKVRAMFQNPCVVRFVPIKPLFSVGGWYHHSLVKDTVDGKWRSEDLWEEIAYNGVTVNLATVAILAAIAAYTAVLRIVSMCAGTRHGATAMKKQD